MVRKVCSVKYDEPLTAEQIADKIRTCNQAEFIGNMGTDRLYHFSAYGTTVALNIPYNDNIRKHPLTIWGTIQQIGFTKRALEVIIGGIKIK